MAGVKILHVPYKGSSGARTDVLGGQVNMMFDAITTMSEYVKSNQVRAMGTTGLSRSSILPAVSTISESGVPKYEMSIWLGLMAPAGTPRDVIESLNKAVVKIQRTPEVVDIWAKQGATPLVMNPAAFTNYLNADIQKWANIVKSAGIKAQ
jgi:tripartite-type tricarboxylate transporter receptor subunit TctC